MLKSIRAKLIASFVVLIILISFLSTYSVINVNTSSQGFNAYQEMAKTSSLSGHFESSVQMAQLKVKDYLHRPVNKEVEEFNVFYEVAMADLDKANQGVTSPERAEMLKQTSEKMTQYQTEFVKVQQLTDESNAIILNEMNAVAPKIERLVTDVMNDANRAGNQELSLSSTQAIRNLLLGQLYAIKFVYTNSRANMNRAIRELRKFSSTVSKLKSLLEQESHIQKTDEAQKLVKIYSKAIEKLYNTAKERNGNIKNMESLGAQLTTLAEEIRSSIQADQDILGPEVEENNQQIMTLLIAVSLIVVFIAALIALTIPRSIINGLGAIQNSLANISRTGDFTIRADVSREDEIGEMGKAVNQMLMDTQAAIKEANSVLAAIADGRFDERISVSLSGDLNELKEGVNSSAESVSFMMAELSKVMHALEEGDFSVKMDTAVAESFRQQVEGALQSIDATVSDILTVMGQMQQGEFGHRVEVDAKGELLKLKNGINQSMSGLDSTVNDLINVISAQSEGNLSVQLSNDYQGKLALLQEALDNTSNKLNQVVSGASNAGQIVANAAHEVSLGANSLSASMQQQAAAIEQTSATMDEMNSQVRSNSDNAREVASVTQKMRSNANSGVSVMQQTIVAMTQIQESSHKIADIVSLIDSIAFQTNLLALNAAVEAARAGEHGRGFAVVASEVRSLAQKSADAAKDIKSLIEETVSRVDQGSSLASESGEMLVSINDSVNSVAQMIEKIAKASTEQAEGVNQVFTSISEIDRVTQQNSILVEQTSASAQSMTEQAQTLNDEMSFFSTRHNLVLTAPTENTFADKSLPGLPKSV